MESTTWTILQRTQRKNSKLNEKQKVRLTNIEHILTKVVVRKWGGADVILEGQDKDKGWLYLGAQNAFRDNFLT